MDAMQGPAGPISNNPLNLATGSRAEDNSDTFDGGRVCLRV
jgi:hypothetical protein